MITTLSFPAKIIFGVGSIANLGKEAAKLGRKTLLVTGSKSARETGLLDRAVNDLESNGIEVHVFDKIISNPRAQTIDEGAEIIRQKGLDLIIGLGGGSAMDSAKSLTLATTTDKPIWELTTGAVTMAEPEGKPVPLMLASTVAASGSEQDMASVISNWDIRKKRVLVSPAFLSKTSIIDPELTVTVPRIPTAQGGVDIFSHLVEKYVSAPEISEITNGLYGTLLKIVVDDIPIVLQEPDNIEARTRIAWASTMACSPSMFFGGGVGSLPLHPVGFSISGKYDIAHGDAQAALLPAWIEYTRPARPERFEFLARSGFGKSDMLSATKEWLSKIGMAHSLKSLDADSEELNGIANDCVDASLPQLKANPVGLDAKSVADIYRKSY